MDRLIVLALPQSQLANIMRPELLLTCIFCSQTFRLEKKEKEMGKLFGSFDLYCQNINRVSDQTFAFYQVCKYRNVPIAIQRSQYLDYIRDGEMLYWLNTT